jgi:ElaB/YqjD/DUF883 family membrane-anchored ribosome-binding protein
LKAIGSDGDAKLDEVKRRVQSSLNQAREHLESAGAGLTEGARAAANATDDYVHHNPWQAVGIGTAVGILVGLLVARR